MRLDRPALRFARAAGILRSRAALVSRSSAAEALRPAPPPEPAPTPMPAPARPNAASARPRPMTMAKPNLVPPAPTIEADVKARLFKALLVKVQSIYGKDVDVDKNPFGAIGVARPKATSRWCQRRWTPPLYARCINQEVQCRGSTSARSSSACSNTNLSKSCSGCSAATNCPWRQSSAPQAIAKCRRRRRRRCGRQAAAAAAPARCQRPPGALDSGGGPHDAAARGAGGRPCTGRPADAAQGGKAKVRRGAAAAARPPGPSTAPLRPNHHDTCRRARVARAIERRGGGAHSAARDGQRGEAGAGMVGRLEFLDLRERGCKGWSCWQAWSFQALNRAECWIRSRRWAGSSRAQACRTWSASLTT